MSRKQEKTSSNTSAAILFLLAVLGIVLLSLISKGILVIRKSKFDTNNRFTIGVSSGKNFEAVSFYPKTRSISILKLEEEIGSVDIKKLLALHTDGKIEYGLFRFDNEDVPSLLLKTIFSFGKAQTDLTFFDILRLYLFSRQIPQSEIITKNVSLNSTVFEIDKAESLLFSDENIEKDRQTIEVVNGADISGLGNWVSRLLTNIGANVVLISTSNSPIENSAVYYSGKKTYTVEKLSKVLGFKAIGQEEQSIADIVVLIGKNSVSGFNF